MTAPSKAIDGARVGLSKSLFTTPCERWSKSLTSEGYGQLMRNGKHLLAHRVAYESNVGPIPYGMTVDHLCRNRACVNTDHMEIVTREENGRRGATKTHCKYGHEIAHGAYIEPNGRRECRRCKDARNAARTAEYIRTHRRKAA